MSLKTMSIYEKPREKIQHKGVNSLSHAELLAVVLQTGTRNETAVELGQRIINDLPHGLVDLSSITIEELMMNNGVGPAKGCQLLAAIELGKRVNSEKRQVIGKINSPTSVVDFFKDQLRHLNRERFLVVFLNTKHMITSYETISVGTLNASIVHPREVFNRAIKRSAASIVLVHNHPSGNPSPSREDKAITSRLREVGELVGIKVLDHIIIADDQYFSFKEMALI